MKLILSYLRRHITLLIGLAAAGGIFALVFSLYELPAEAVWYSCALTLAVFALLGLIRFLSYKRRHDELALVMKRMETELSGLPQPADMIEEDYQRLLAALYESKKALAASLNYRDRQNTEYYTLWAHQIKTPIAALSLMLGADARDDKLAAELLRIEQYVDTALGFVRAQSPSSDFVLSRTNLDDVVRGCVRKLARVFVVTKTAFAFDETGLTVLTDEKWLAFCIEQVLTNSLKYASGGHVRVFARGMTLVIEDDGIGIAPEDVPRVFEKGFTGYNGRADKKATGIGLYLTRSVLAKLGHSISLASRPHCGTRVSIDLASNTSRPE